MRIGVKLSQLFDQCHCLFSLGSLRWSIPDIYQTTKDSSINNIYRKLASVLRVVINFFLTTAGK